jgi:hypothetical protein
MPTLNAPFGLQPYRGGGSAAYALQTRRYFIPQANANAFYIGLPVQLAATSDAEGTPGVDVNAGTGAFVGSIVSVEPANVGGISQVGANLNLEQVSIPATKTRDYYVYVADDPNQVFEIQGDATATNQIAANANKCASMTITAPSPASFPISATVLSSSTIATTNTLNLKMLGLSPRPEANRKGFGAFSVWLVKINQHQLANGATGV